MRRPGAVAHAVLLALATVAGGSLGPHVARAQGSAPAATSASSGTTGVTPGAIIVLPIESDDQESQAEALTGAIRSRVRALPGWTLTDSTQTLGMLVTAFRCPPKPDAACLQKVGDQLKTDRFVWGTMGLGGPKQVQVEAHLWYRGHADVVVTEQYSDNLRDQNDEVLRHIAGRLVDKLIGRPVAALLTVHAGEQDGPVLVDGATVGQLEHGQSVVELRPGEHVVEVRVPGYHPTRNRVLAVAGADLVLDVALMKEETLAPQPKSSKSLSPRTIVALASLGVGLGFGVFGTIQGVRFLDLRTKNEDDAKALPRGTPLCPTLREACANLEDAERARVLEIVSFGVGAALVGTGIVLLITDPSRDAPPSRAARPSRWRVAPRVGATQAGGDFALSF